MADVPAIPCSPATAAALRVDPGEFWRMAKGTKLVDIPTRPIQGTLFDDDDDEGGRIPLPLI